MDLLGLGALVVLSASSIYLGSHNALRKVEEQSGGEETDANGCPSFHL